MTHAFALLFYSMPKGITIINDYTTDEKVRRFATDIAREAVEKWGDTHGTAKYLKEKLDDNFSGVWCCIVGKDFHNYVTMECFNYIEVKIGEVYVVMFQSKP